MRRLPSLGLLLTGTAVVFARTALAPAEPPGHPPATSQAAPPERPAKAKTDGEFADDLSVTEHTLQLPDGSLAFRATAGTLAMPDEAGKPLARFFFVGYEKTAAAGDARQARPVTFVFNGGPGAASVWLHLGTAGPRIVALDEFGHAPAPPVTLVDNPDTWLVDTDLVFIDPVGTGFSRPAPGRDGKEFFGVKQDLASVAEFIRLYTTRYQRWASPKFLAGESYGTTRAAALADLLADDYGIRVNGIVLVSTVLDFQTISFGQSNDLPYVLYLPTYTAVAHFHHRLPPDLQDAPLEQTLRDVGDWSTRVYLPALARGGALPEAERADVRRQLARFSGLSETLVDRADLRVPAHVFMKELLADRRQVVGRFDARLTGPDLDPLQSWPAYDPSLAGFLEAYTAAFNQMVRRELKFETDLPYAVLSDRVQPWDFGKSEAGYLDVVGDLRSAMVKNPHLKVLVAGGRYDLATPFFATAYTVAKLNLPKELRGNVTQTYYDAGHMLYHHAPDRQKLAADIRSFLSAALPRAASAK